MPNPSIPPPFLAVKPASPVGVGETVFANLLVAAAYAITGLAGLRLAFFADAVTLFWPPSGIAFAVVWMGGLRLMPGVWLGALIVSLFSFGTPAAAVVVGSGNALPPLVAVWALRSMFAERNDPGEMWRVLWFILAAALGTTTISATIGTLVVTNAPTSTQPWQAVWLESWLGQAMGVVVVAPPLLLWRRLIDAEYDWRDRFDALAFTMAGLGIVAGLLLLREPIWAMELCKLFTVLLSLWAGARFGVTGPAMMTLLMAAGAISATVLGVGPFARGDFYDSFASLHSYLFAEAIAGIMLAAALADLRRVIAAEQQARRAAEAAAAQRVLLLTMISHDVRNPLGGIMGVLQLLQRAPLAAGEARLVELATRAGGTLTTLINDILDVARMDSDRIALASAPFDPARALADVVEIHRARADLRGLQLALEADGLPPLLLGDRARFEQLVGNLVSNAINYTPAGWVVVAARWQDALTVTVSDTGPGIPAERVPTLFDAFAQPSAARAAGLGLGLHICRQLVTLMGGSIAYEAAVGHGSVFSITLPLPLPAADDAGSSALPVADPPRYILLVEDDPIASEVTAALLRELGHRVVTAADSAAALAAARVNSFDLILLDMQLGGESGLALADVLAPLQPAARLLALTADASTEARALATGAGLAGVLVKPLSVPNGLAAAIAAVTVRHPGRAGTAAA